MTTIDFYTHCADPLDVAARLVVKAWGQHGARARADAGRRGNGRARPLAVAGCRRPASCRIAGSERRCAAETPIVVDHALEHQGPAAVLINLHPSPPPFFSRFERLVEIVGRRRSRRPRPAASAGSSTRSAATRCARTTCPDGAEPMPTARELLEQADALMRRNRALADAEAAAAGPRRTTTSRSSPRRSTRRPPGASTAAPRAVASLDDVPELTDAVEEIEAPSILEPSADDELSRWLEIDRGEKSVTGPAPDSIVVVPAALRPPRDRRDRHPTPAPEATSRPRGCRRCSRRSRPRPARR